MDDRSIGLPDGDPSPGDGVALRAVGLTKAYGSTQALRSCSVTLTPGEVHAVVGENGSGKSTMVKILTGVTQPDAGTIHLGGVARRAFRGTGEALGAGIVGVFQNTMIVNTQSVMDNVWLGGDGIVRRRVDRVERRVRARETLAELLSNVPNLDAEAGALPLSERQALGIARALLREPRILILDEATSALDIATRDRLFVILKRLAEAGTSVVFISHRMDEIEEIGDVITVMRAGETVASVKRGNASSADIVGLMVGDSRAPAHEWFNARRERERRQTLEVIGARGVSLRHDYPPIDASILAGELVGVAGLEGHGQERFLQVLAGARPASGTVSVTLDDRLAVITSRRRARSLGVAYVPRDRQSAGVFDSLSICDNFAMSTVAEDRRRGVLRRTATRRRLAEYVESLKIKLADPRDAISTLSGGNQQKVVVSRALACSPRVLLLDDPTRGIDPGAKRDLYDLLVGLTGEGMAIVMVSTDVDELVQLADRVLVFREGHVSADIRREELTRHSLVSSFFGK
jgi:ABC-type sugar transport system ATPase subunit